MNGRRMKRKQFHLSIAEEEILYEISKKNNISEAEVVRMAIRELAKTKLNRPNSLLSMAQFAGQTKEHQASDLSENHDHYLLEINENE